MIASQVSQQRASLYATRPKPSICRIKGSRAQQWHGQSVNALPELQAALQELTQQVVLPNPGIQAGLAANSAVFTLGYGILRKGLSPMGVAHSWFLGTAIFSAFGIGGYLLVCLYFIFGTLVTKVKMEQKQKEGIAEARSGLRGPGSVWGSGIAGVACAVLALVTGDYALWQVGFVASFCSKLSDTVSSEIGKAYGQTTYLITTLARVPRGSEGAVSAEGTAAGVFAAVAFTAVALLTGQASSSTAPAIIAAAVVANTFESYLGATVQGSVPWLTNDMINMIQICLAAALAVGAKATGLLG